MLGILEAKPKVGYIYLGAHKNFKIIDKVSKILAKEIMSKPTTVNEETMVYDAIVFLFLNDRNTFCRK